MLLATILLIGALPQSGELARSVATVPAAIPMEEKTGAKDSGAGRELPSMPKPKVDGNAADAGNGTGSSVVQGVVEGAANGAAVGAAGLATKGRPEGASAPLVAALSAGEAVRPPHVTLALQPVKAAYTRPRETRGQRVAWYALAVTGHGAAAFDAYSTRRALSGGYGTEGNPLLRPFAHSSALYAATQVSPAVMDLLGKRMMVSENRWLRKMWWLPQAAGSGFSIGAGAHNMNVVR
jgi:hypothetical protein